MLIIGAWAFSHKLFTLLLLQLVTFQLIKRNMPSVGLSLVNVEFSMGSEEISEICFRCRKKYLVYCLQRNKFPVTHLKMHASYPFLLRLM
jgi:hypothetical protein